METKRKTIWFLLMIITMVVSCFFLDRMENSLMI